MENQCHFECRWPITDVFDGSTTLPMTIANDLATLFSSISNFEKYLESRSVISPKYFHYYLMLIFSGNNNECDKHPTPSLCLNSSDCLKRLLLCALSATKGFFTYHFQQKNLMTKFSNEDNKCDVGSAVKKNQLRAAEQLSQSDEWCKEASDLMKQDRNEYCKLMVKYIFCNCIFTSYQAKKVFFSMIKGKFIDVHLGLKCLEENASSTTISIYFNILKELLSPNLFIKSVNQETFEHFQSSNFLLCYLTHQFESKQETFLCTKEVFEYLSLLIKIMKFAMRNEENLCNFLCHFLQGSVLPYTDIFFSIPLECKGHLICSKYLKLLCELLSDSFLHSHKPAPQCVVKLSNMLVTQLLDSLKLASTDILLSSNNFVCTVMLKESSVSVVIKLIIEVSFRACAISLTGEGRQPIVIGNNIHSLWISVEPFIKKTREDWLPYVFGDQDDKWILSLQCLFIIWTEINKFMKSCEEYAPEAYNSIKELIKWLCPHYLFFQFSRFLGYDHLMLVDFLTASETDFLNYFVYYLHHIIDNWNTFSINSVSFTDSNISESYFFKSNTHLHSEPDKKTEEAIKFGSKRSKKNRKIETDSLKYTNEGKKSLVFYSDSEESNEHSDNNSDEELLTAIPLSLQKVESNPNGKHFTDPLIISAEAIQVIEMFIRLRLHIQRLQEKNIFPYNAKPLLKLLEKIENNYDKFSHH